MVVSFRTEPYLCFHLCYRASLSLRCHRVEVLSDCVDGPEQHSGSTDRACSYAEKHGGKAAEDSEVKLSRAPEFEAEVSDVGGDDERGNEQAEEGTLQE
jgi:hypothetical protein